MTTRRNGQIDTAKGLLMTLVILGHVLLASKDLTPAGSFLLKVIYSFHMPAFLIISGMLFDGDRQRQRSASKYILSKAKHIMIPYFVIEILGGIVHNVFAYGERESVLVILKNVITFHKYVGASWYLVAYFLASVLLFLINKIGKKSFMIQCLTALVFFAIVCAFQFKGINEANIELLRVLLSYSVMVIGLLFKYVLKSFNWWYVTIACIGFLASVALNSTVFVHAAAIGNPFLFLLGSICGTYLILQISSGLHVNLLNILGEYSIVPMGIHQNIIWIFGWFFGLDGSWPVVIVNFFIAYAISVTVTMIYREIKKCTIFQS